MRRRSEVQGTELQVAAAAFAALSSVPRSRGGGGSPAANLRDRSACGQQAICRVLVRLRTYAEAGLAPPSRAIVAIVTSRGELACDLGDLFFVVLVMRNLFTAKFAAAFRVDEAST